MYGVEVKREGSKHRVKGKTRKRENRKTGKREKGREGCDRGVAL
jgi:hypothetical protein